MSRYPTRRIDSTGFSQNDEKEGYSREMESRSERDREEKNLDIPARCPLHGNLQHMGLNGKAHCSYCGEEIR